MTEPEYIVTDKDMIAKYGHVPDLANMVPVDDDEDDYAVPTKYIPAPEDDSGW